VIQSESIRLIFDESEKSSGTALRFIFSHCGAEKPRFIPLELHTAPFFLVRL